MRDVYDGLILYHGSYCEVRKPELKKSAARKDFGKGFYLTSSKEQAENFLRTAIGKAVTKGDAPENQDYGYISVFKVHRSDKLKSHIFETANEEWLHCIAAHRKRNSFTEIEKLMSVYDVIIGKIADDQTNTTLAAYIGGTFGPVGSKEADDICIRLLLPEKLKDQYCFRTENAIDSLEFVESEKIWVRK
ncbi:MAG: DUF3990 domain-containing protein [Eubacteriales bacterium]|nr:DUF3990 domain-containing protein [Eubacteriales bacterium]